MQLLMLIIRALFITSWICAFGEASLRLRQDLLSGDDEVVGKQPCRSQGILQIFTTIFEASPADEDPSVACDNDLSLICSMDHPSSLTDIYYARSCLWQNKDDISPSCHQYLTTINPSIIEPCFKEIQDFCPFVVPGFNNIHKCLIARGDDLTVRCDRALKEEAVRDAELISGNDVQESDLTTILAIEDISTPAITLARRDYREVFTAIFSSLAALLGDEVVLPKDIFIFSSDDSVDSASVAELAAVADQPADEASSSATAYSIHGYIPALPADKSPQALVSGNDMKPVYGLNEMLAQLVSRERDDEDRLRMLQRGRKEPILSLMSWISSPLSSATAFIRGFFSS